jgi:hypothetical protein
MDDDDPEIVEWGKQLDARRTQDRRGATVDDDEDDDAPDSKTG